MDIDLTLHNRTWPRSLADSKCHEKRNLAEYEGHIEIEDQLLKDLINATQTLEKKVKLLNI